MEQFSLDAMVWYTASKKMVNGGGFNFEAKVALWLYLVMRRNTKRIRIRGCGRAAALWSCSLGLTDEEL